MNFCLLYHITKDKFWNLNIETNFFESSGLYWICNSKTIKILKYLTVKILFYKGLFKNKRGPGTSF